MNLTQADDGRNLGELSIADPLRNGEAGDGDPSKKIIPKEPKTVGGQPFQGWNEVLEGFNGPPLRGFVLELMEGIIRKEGLLEIRSEDGGEAPGQGEIHSRFRCSEGRHFCLRDDEENGCGLVGE